MHSAPTPRRETSPQAIRVAAQAALAICADADRLAREATEAAIHDDERLPRLMEQRDELLGDLAEQLAVIRFSRPAADHPIFAQTERKLDEADRLVDQVMGALATSEKATQELVLALTKRSNELRAEIDAVQRASSASVGYGAASTSQLVDRVL